MNPRTRTRQQSPEHGGKHRERRYPTAPRAQSTIQARDLNLHSSVDCPVIVCHARRVSALRCGGFGVDGGGWRGTVRAPRLRWCWPGVGPPRVAVLHHTFLSICVALAACDALRSSRAAQATAWIAPTSAACSVRCIRAVRLQARDVFSARTYKGRLYSWNVLCRH